MANRYWVGGSGTWNTTSTTNWSATSGGAGGASVPTAADNVFFNQAGTYTVTCTGALACLDFTVSAGTVTFTLGTSPTFSISGSLSLATGTIWNTSGTITFNSTTPGKTITTNGISFSGSIVLNGAGGEWTLGSALTTTNVLSVTQGSFISANYAISVSTLSSSNTNVRSINLGSSTVTVSTNVTFTNTTNLTFNAGTSTIVCNYFLATFNGGSLNYYNVSFTGTVSAGGPIITISGQNTFNNLSISGRTSQGISNIAFTADQTVTDTLTLTAGTNGNFRLFLRSDAIGIPRTINVVSFSAGLADVDFRDIVITGSASPISGTRLGDCGGNTGVTFPAPKTVYYRGSTASTVWSDGTSWSATIGGTSGGANFPLAQDTIVVPASLYPPTASSIAVSTSYNIGTIDLSLRTTNTVTLNFTGSPTIYGNWINGTGSSISGTISVTFAGRTTQTITSAGILFPIGIIVNCPSSVLRLLDSFSSSSSSGLVLTQGTFDTNGYTTAFSQINVSGTLTRTLAIGSSTLVGSTSGGFNASSSTNLTVTGTGTISLTGNTSKPFSGGGIQTYPTINQGGTGTLTISGNNKFSNITNTAIGTVRFTGGSTNEFDNFNLNGTTGSLVTLSSTNTTPAILKKSGTWNVGINSTDNGNNTGLSFTGTSPNYLSISYITGQLATVSKLYLGSANILSIKYGATTVSAVYLGSTKVF